MPIFIREEIEQGIEVISNQLKSEDRVWLKLCAKFFGTKKDVFLCSLYMSPDTFLLEIIFERKRYIAQEGPIALTNDYSARTGSLPDCIIHDSTYYTQLLQNYSSDHPLPRNSEDTIINGYGRELLNLCK